MDPRKKFISGCIANLCGLDNADILNKTLAEKTEIDRFLDDASCSILQATACVNEDGSYDLQVSNDLAAPTSDDGEAKAGGSFGGAQFVKLRPEPITDTNFRTNVMVTSMQQSPISSLYHALHKVYAPVLLRDASWSQQLDTKVQGLLSELDAGLGSVMRNGKGSSPAARSDDDFSGIVTPEDEFQFWIDKSSVHGPDRDRATKFRDPFEGICGRFRRLSAGAAAGAAAGELSLAEALELLEDTQNALDEVWKMPGLYGPQQYPEPRMAHLLGVIASALSRFVTQSLSSLDLWTHPFGEVRAALTQGGQLCEKWNAVCVELTDTYWARHDDHRWMGPPHSNAYLAAFAGRLEEVLRLRTTHEELRRLLSPAEQRQLNVDDSFSAFDGTKPLHYNPYTQEDWQRCVAAYERTLTPIEQHMAGKLRSTVFGQSDRPQLLLRQLSRYQHLLMRPNISRELSSERESLLGQLIAYVEQLDTDFESRSSRGGREGPPRGRNLSPAVNKVVWSQQLRSKVARTLDAARAPLLGLDTWGEFQEVSKALVDKASKYEKQEFRGWMADVEEAMDDGELSLQMSGRLMEIDLDGNLTVNYSERLVCLLREVRQFSELGLSVPRSILRAAKEGEKYYRYGVMLKKVANFYNTMGTQMIDTQKPMLLESLLLFEDRVKNSGSTVTWSDPGECQTYVDRLQKAAERLSTENRKLRKVHVRLSEEVTSLMGIDLLRQRERWKSQWVTLRDLMVSLAHRYPADRMTRWRLHWDYQLYKALEASYQMGLESLNEHLSTIRAELVFAQKRLQFRPPLEELRANYYREMKKFISIPTSFGGFGNAVVFKKMADRNADSLIRVYVKAEALFSRLTALRDSLVPWVALGMVQDIDSFVEQHVKKVADWDVNLKMLKSKRKEVEKLPDFHKIDCIHVSAAPFKAAVEDQMQRLGDALLLSLRRSTLDGIKQVEAFLEASTERLSSLPHTIEEITVAKRDWKEIVDKKGELRDLTRVCEEQKKLLLSVAGAGSGSVDTGEVVSRLAVMPSQWENFEISVEAFNDIIEESREKMKGDVDRQVMECNQNVDKFSDRWTALKPKEVPNWEKETLEAVYASLDDWREQLTELLERSAQLTENCEQFGMPPPSFPRLQPLELDMESVSSSWRMHQEFTAELETLGQTDWITFRGRIYEAQDLANKWAERLKQRLKSMTAGGSGEEAKDDVGRASYDPVTERIQDRVTVLRKSLPALKFCRGEPFKDEHWTQLFHKLKMPKGTRLDTLTFQHFLDVLDAVVANSRFAKELTSRAQGEVTIREALFELKAWAETAEFTLMEHEENGRHTALITDWKDLFTELGDNQSLLQSLKESQYFKPFADQATQYETKMAALDEYLHMINSIQRKWVYLEPIFGRGALPSEQARFRRVDEEFRDIMGKLETEPLLFNLADDTMFPRMADSVATMLDQLERCQKALADFLEEKRSRMPRFYFIGDDDLLEILGQAKNPRVIQAHLKKLFQGVHRVDFDESGAAIETMRSVAGEVVPLESPVTITDQVECWLADLSSEMKRTLLLQLVRCAQNEADLNIFPSQVLNVSEQVFFTGQCERAIAQGTLSELSTFLANKLQQFTSFNLANQPLLQLKVKALVLELIHSMEVVSMLQREGIQSTQDWEWQKQLRFYLPEGEAIQSSPCVVRMVNAQFDYTYEYQGNAGKLVHTPLTDKCYLTLTQGMHMGYGGNPYGPAGTGKTESVKALGGQLGRQVLVFNCDEGIDFQSMGRIFTGLVKCGAWGCFDEFNRLKEDQLSAVSQQIQVIQAAIKEKAPTVKLMGATIDVDCNAGIFVTMNPAGKHYGGRSKLPDNLKQLFRPVAMSKPDNDLIAEVILYSEGFSAAKVLGHKMVSLFTLSKQLLTPQQHYDWGLRAMKAVLNTGGKIITQAKATQDSLSEETEIEILIKAVRVNTLSKLTFSDAQRFLSLISDVFPGVKSEDLGNAELEAAIKEVMTNKPFSLVFDDGQVRKMLQLKESLDQRMGCVIVGPSGCGKSTLWRVLQAALIKTGQTIKSHVMNPKSMPRERLLGQMDLDTREWTDGVLTEAARQVVKEPFETRSWIVCDGDVDPEWIESLNSVLDDNHLLTMPNGERISFGSNINFLFETHDLRFASPATISRMGMIFLSDQDVDVRRLVNTWMNSQPQAMRASLQSWVDDLFYRALDYVLKEAGDMVVDTTMVGTVLNGLSHVSGLSSKGEFVCGMIRGLGGNLPLQARSSFAKEVFMWAGERPPDLARPLDCFYANNTYQSYAAQQELDGDIMRTPVLETVGVQRNLKMVEPWADACTPFILVGPEGSGKQMLLHHLFSKRRSTRVTTLHCNAQTSAEHVIQKIQQACSLFSTNQGRVYRPRDCETLVLYLKDINLPKPDQYDTCMLIAFLQQLITFDGFYDANLEFLGMERVHIVCSMNPSTTVGRHALSTRFTAICRIAAIDYPSNDELGEVYSALLTAALQRSLPADPRWQRASDVSKLAGSMVALYEQVKAKFSIDDHRHYLFTPRDLTDWTRGLLRYDLGAESLLDVWAYEAQRLFRDRLVDGESEARFDGLLNSLLRQQWRHTPELLDSYFTALAGGGEVKGEVKGGDGDGDEDGAAPGIGVRLGRLSAEDFRVMVRQGVTMYEREEKDLHMLLFAEILDHVARVERVLSTPGGSLLLIGRSGVGRRTAATLVAHMHHMTFSSPNLTLDYSSKQFNVDLKAVLALAGVEDEQVLLYVEDHQLTEPAILETLNSLLASGEVPGLYTHEELEPMLAPLRELMAEAGGFRTPYDFFVSRVRSNLHVALGMDPRHPDFLMRCESNPALYTRCSILWMGEWRRGSMRQVPVMLLPELFGGFGKDENGEEVNYGDIDDELLEQVVSIHDSCRARGATPRDFVSFLENYRRLYDVKYGALNTEIDHLESGLSKLREASATVDELSRDANVQRKELQIKQGAADKAMDEITSTLESASERRKEVEILREELGRAEVETKARKQAIEEQLSGIQPVLEQARRAVGGIKSDHLNEIRSLKMPPEPIHDVLSAVLMLLGIRDTSWLSMRRFLANKGVKDEILHFNADAITPEIRKSVSRLLKQKGSSFEQANIYRVSVAAAPLAAWVKANIRYSLVLDKIQPLRASLVEATRTLQSSQERLEECESELNSIDDRVARLKDEFKQRTREAESLKTALQRTELTLEKAGGLLQQLSGELTRWDQQVGDLTRQKHGLKTQVLLAAGFTTYLAQTPEDQRQEMIVQWQQLCRCGSFDYRKLLSSESELLTWKAEGLPADNLSMENAIVILQSEQQCPFIIDPATTATQWLIAHLEADKSCPLEVVNTNDPRFTMQVELAVRFGKTLVILEVDKLDPMLYPLVRRDLQHQGPRNVVQIGDKQIDYNEKFRMFLVTRTPDPMLPPDASSLLSEVNFTVTRSGLEGQLLGVTIQHEQPELELQKSALLKQEEDFKVQLAGLEKELLEALATSEGNILDNIALIESLTKTKLKSAEITEALTESTRASEELDRQREVFRPFAHNGSRMFFLIQRLQSADNMYQFSLASFLQLFTATLGAAMDAMDLEERIKRLTPQLETRVLFFVGRSLFKAHRLMFAMHLVRGMHPDLFQDNDWEFFVGELVPDLEDGRPRDFPSWAATDRAPMFSLLCNTFPRLVSNLQLQDTDSWSRWARSSECEKEFPPKITRSLNSFQRVLVVQTLRPDRLYSAMDLFVSQVLGVATVSPPPVSLPRLHEEESNNTTPILMITTAGADPSKELADFAEKRVGRDHYQELAMGGGQSKVALKMLAESARVGDWLCLKNLHLVTSWLPVLEKELNSLTPHPQFRLWLTTESHPKFPPILLQQSLKVTFESPPGLKKNLQRTYEAWEPEYISSGTPQRAQLLFMLAWFHAIVQERRSYIPQGWTKFYEFSFSDLRAGAAVIDMALPGNGAAPDWSTLHGLMLNSVYGGRVDNPYDGRVLTTYLQQFFCNDMLAGGGGGGGMGRRGNLLPGITRVVPLPGATTSHGEYIAAIQSVPDTDSPALFGLPMNIQRSVQRANSAAVIAQLKSLAALAGAAAKFDREVWRVGLTPLLDLWERLAGQLSGSDGSGGGGGGGGESKMGDMSPVDAFVVMEEAASADLLRFVGGSLNAIRRVVYGTGLLTPAVQANASALLAGEVPRAWSKKWEGPEKPQAFLRGLVVRRVALTRWLGRVGRGDGALEGELQLSELFNPGTFLNALRQQTARLAGCSMDSLMLTSSWDASHMRSAPLPVSLGGLLLQGAGFDGASLITSDADAQELVSIPPCMLAYVSKDDAAGLSDDRNIGVPLYYSTQRERLLVELNMPSAGESAQWILAGIALFLCDQE